MEVNGGQLNYIYVYICVYTHAHAHTCIYVAHVFIPLLLLETNLLESPDWIEMIYTVEPIYTRETHYKVTAVTDPLI